MTEAMEEVVIRGEKAIPLSEIDLGPENVRKTRVESGLDSLKESIQRFGLIQPVVVVKEGPRFKLISGQRRFIAFQALGRPEIPAIIIEPVSATTSALISLGENLQRKKLPYEDTVRIVSELFDRGKGSPSKRINQVVRDTGLTRGTVIRYLSYRLVPEPVRDLVSEGKLTAEIAARITSSFWPDTAKIAAISREAIMMTKAEWDRAVEAGIQRPGAPVKYILDLAKKPPIRYEVRIPLDAESHDALLRLAKVRKTDIVTLVKDTIEELLEEEDVR